MNTKKILSGTLLVLAMVLPLQAGENVDVKVKGMVCSFCAQGLLKNFKEEPSVEKVNVVLKEKKLSLTLKNGQSLSDEQIKHIVLDAGYNVEKIERKQQ